MNNENLIAKAAEFQSYYHTEKREDENVYNGLDDWKMGEIKDTRLYALVPDAFIEDYISGERTPKFLFDQATFDRYVDAETGAFDSKELSQAVQVEPYQNQLMKTQGYAEYRTTILVIDRKGDLELPVGYCQANDQFGPGGAHQCFISEEKMKECQADGTLQYNLTESLRNRGFHERITNAEYEEINTASKKRIASCRRQISEIQKSVSGFAGPVHPNEDEYPHPFQKSLPLPGNPFQSKALKPELTMKDYKTLINLRKEEMPNDCAAQQETIRTDRMGKTDSSPQR